jgi:hypothetical protein
MEIHVESADGAAASLDERIRQEITAQYPDLMKNLMLGIFQMRTQVHPVGSLRVGRKLRRLVDLRHGHPVPEAADAPKSPSVTP